MSEVVVHKLSPLHEGGSVVGVRSVHIHENRAGDGPLVGERPTLGVPATRGGYAYRRRRWKR